MLVNRLNPPLAQRRLQARLLAEPDPGRRDRLWTALAPPLMRTTDISPAESLAQANIPAGSFPLPERQRLGHYFEDLVAELIDKQADPSTLHRNIQCRLDGRTIGEFDFLFARDRRWFHLETAVKFYLCVGNGSALNQFVGPGLHDRLDLKWARLNDHQLRLGRQTAGQRCLETLGIGPVEPRLLMPGYLFYPLERDDDVPDASIAPEHLRGWWLTQERLDCLPGSDAHRYAILPKLRWLSPARLPEMETLEPSALRQCLAVRSQPVLVAAMAPLSGVPGIWGETSRGFVVPDGWPRQAVSASLSRP